MSDGSEFQVCGAVVYMIKHWKVVGKKHVELRRTSLTEVI